MNSKMKNANTSTGVNDGGKLFAVPAWSTGGETDETTLHSNLLFVKLFTDLHSSLQTTKHTHIYLFCTLNKHFALRNKSKIRLPILNMKCCKSLSLYQIRFKIYTYMQVTKEEVLTLLALFYKLITQRSLWKLTDL